MTRGTTAALPRTTAEADGLRRSRTRVGLVVAAVLGVSLLRDAVVAVLAAPGPLVVVGGTGLAGLVLLVGWTALRFRDRLERPAPGVAAAVLGGQVACVALVCLAAREQGLVTAIFVCLSATYLVRRPAAAWIVAAGVLAMVGLPRVVPGWQPDDGSTAAAVLGGVAVVAMLQGMERNRQLRRAQEEVAALAAARERERITRDMHDVLGHSLTVISVKAELAGRLLESADRATSGPAAARRAADELADVQSLARSALADVRATIADERRASLAGELATARSALDAAGIDADLPGAVDVVPAGRRELFAWVLREGSTNVLRHAAARHVRITVSADALVVEDDGRGAGGPGTTGHGLTGLADRAREAGAVLEAGPRPGGGFRLAVTVADPASDPVPDPARPEPDA
ncbi:histidine kinase [Promicromonospora citrea]|uniref:histidine kinase n=1 Tax=Promicromonospora citrea TaxID=43677 RepID=UPI0014876A1F|nr:histidine kinase [Promicromonospora citrea]NNH51985.1 sensor histidine kinase [Promicromonospora citrea]